MVTRACGALTLSLVGLAGCYDLERLDPGPRSPYLLVDDFELDPEDTEDDRWLPDVPGFGRWSVLPFKPGPGASHAISIVEPGFDSEYSLLGEFLFADPGNGVFTGASLGIVGPRVQLDVRQYRAIHVAASFDSGTTSFPDNTRFYAELTCSSALPLGNVTVPFFVQRSMGLVTSDWKALRLDLDQFVEPSPEEPLIAGGPRACLSAVDAIRFTISTSLGGRPPVGGSFFIDDVYFE